MSFAGQAFGDPVNVVLGEEFLVTFKSCTVGDGVAPAVEEVAAFSGFAAYGCLCFCCSGAVVDDDNFVVAEEAEGNLVEFGAVGDGVGVEPVRASRAAFFIAFGFISTEITEGFKGIEFFVRDVVEPVAGGVEVEAFGV